MKWIGLTFAALAMTATTQSAQAAVISNCPAPLAKAIRGIGCEFSGFIGRCEDDPCSGECAVPIPMAAVPVCQ